MSKVNGRPTGKFIKIAEKIVDGLLSSGTCTRCVGYTEKPSEQYLKFKDIMIIDLVTAIADAIYEEITTHSSLTLRNSNGEIVAKLYINPDGTLADDSWLCNEGWK